MSDSRRMAYLLGELSTAETQAYAELLATSAAERAALRALELGHALTLLPAASPPAGGFAALLAATTATPRLATHSAAVARLLDVSEDESTAMLAALDLPQSYVPGPMPGSQLVHVQGGPAVADAVTGFVRFPAGEPFPHHEHLGQEWVLILQGHMDLDGTRHGPGALLEQAAGTAHAFCVAAGADLIYLLVAKVGLRVGEHSFLADDPRV